MFCKLQSRYLVFSVITKSEIRFAKSFVFVYTNKVKDIILNFSSNTRKTGFITIATPLWVGVYLTELKTSVYGNTTNNIKLERLHI